LLFGGMNILIPINKRNNNEHYKVAKNYSLTRPLVKLMKDKK